MPQLAALSDTFFGVPGTNRTAIFLFKKAAVLRGFPNHVHEFDGGNTVWGSLPQCERMIASLTLTLGYAHAQREYALCASGKTMQYLKQTRKERQNSEL